jgi:dihydropteroate synthase
LEDRIEIMGILNVTPDSFYDGGNFFDKNVAFRHALKIFKDGADIIDVGGESTRPGAEPVSIDEEVNRVCPVIEMISKEIDVKISIDTSKSEVARAAIQSGASMINDISGFTFDDKMVHIAAKEDVEVVLMHIHGTPKDMQVNPCYDDLIMSIYSFLDEALQRAVKGGVKKDKLIVDPGIGFGKTLEHNYVIINNIPKLKELGCPVLIGLSRKSLIGKLYEKEEDRLPATIALNVAAIMKGAGIIRVHDIKEHKLALTALELLNRVS